MTNIKVSEGEVELEMSGSYIDICGDVIFALSSIVEAMEQRISTEASKDFVKGIIKYMAEVLSDGDPLRELTEKAEDKELEGLDLEDIEDDEIELGAFLKAIYDKEFDDEDE